MQQHLGHSVSNVDAAAVDGRSTPGRLRAVRAISALVAVLSVVALGLMALGSNHTVLRHTTVLKKVEATARNTPGDGSGSPSTSGGGAAAGAPAAPVLITASPLVTTQAVTAASITGEATDPTADPVPAPSVPTGTTVPSAPTPAALPACPFPLPTPAHTGGLATLIGLSPLFGPFSAEAFAPAAAFQPVLELFGPFLVEFADVYAGDEPSLAPLIDQLESLENEGFTVISPLYGPYRTQFLTAETSLASALAPYAQKLASNPASSCLVDIEGILTSAAPG